MNKLTLLALVGATSACPFHGWRHGPHHDFGDVFGGHHDHHHHHGHHHKQHGFTPFHAAPECNIAAEDKMTNLELGLHLQNGVYRSLVKGLYRATSDPISEECWGSWLEDDITKMVDLWKPVKEFDIYSLNVTEAKDIAHLWIDAHWKDREVCQYEKVGDDLKHWCLDDMDRCFGQDGKMMERAQEKGLEIIQALYDLVMLVVKHDRCATDEERVEEAKKVSEDVARIIAYLVGFEETWDPAEKEHITKREFWLDLAEYAKDLSKKMIESALEIEEKMEEMRPKQTHRFGFEAPEVP